MNVRKMTFIAVAVVLLLVLGVIGCSAKAGPDVPHPRIVWIETTITCGWCNTTIHCPEMAMEIATIHFAPDISEEERELQKQEFMYNWRNTCPCRDEDRYD